MRTCVAAAIAFFALSSLCFGQKRALQYHATQAVKLGWRYFNKGDTDTALKSFKQAMLIDSRFAPAYFGAAYVYCVQKKLDLAILIYRKSIEIDPTYSHAYSNLGLALLYSKKPHEAHVMLKKALETDPNNGDAHVNIALYYFGTEQYEDCWNHIHHAQDLKTKIRKEFLDDLASRMPEPDRARTPSPAKKAGGEGSRP